MKIIFFTLIAYLCSPALAYIGGEGNGQGGICIDDRCISLVEAGLRIEPEYQSGYELSPELVQKVREIIDSLPLPLKQRSDLLEKVIGKKNTFRPIAEIDQKKYDKALGEYRILLNSVLGDSDVPWKNNTLLLAISDQKSVSQEYATYLLPEFFRGDLETQALTLIHESSVRGEDSRILRAALEFDTALYRYISRDSKFRELDLLLSAYKLWIIRTDVFKRQMISLLFRKIGKPIEPQEICVDGKQECTLSRAKLITSSNIDKDLRSIVSGWKLSYFDLYDSNSLFSMTKSNDDYRAKWKRNSLVEFCSQQNLGIIERKTFFISYSTRIDNFSWPLEVNCRVDEKYITFKIILPYFSNEFGVKRPWTNERKKENKWTNPFFG